MATKAQRGAVASPGYKALQGRSRKWNLDEISSSRIFLDPISSFQLHVFILNLLPSQNIIFLTTFSDMILKTNRMNTQRRVSAVRMNEFEFCLYHSSLTLQPKNDSLVFSVK